MGSKVDAMNIRQLKAFRATVLAGTVSGAADLLDLSQPSISRLIGQLEASLNLVLFDRISGRLILTPEGRLIYEQVEQAFNALGKIHEYATDIQHSRVGKLSIACMPALGLGFLPAVIGEFCTENPGVTITLDIQTSSKIEDWITTQHVDIGLAQLPFGREGIIVDQFCSVPYIAALPKGHELARHALLTPEHFENQRFISLTLTNSVRHLIDRLFVDRGVRRQMFLETSYLPTVCKLVEHDVGVSLVDALSVHESLRSIEVRPVEPSLMFDVGLMYASHRPLAKVGRQFISYLKQRRDAVLSEVASAAGIKVR